MRTNSSIILFDGICNLCNDSVQFVIRRDKKKQFKFASLQSSIGQSLLLTSGFKDKHLDSFVLIMDDHYYTQSSAALMVLQKLGKPWSLLYSLIIIPPFIRNAIYSVIARNRYTWFGKRKECMIPSEDLQDRFLI